MVRHPMNEHNRVLRSGSVPLTAWCGNGSMVIPSCEVRACGVNSVVIPQFIINGMTLAYDMCWQMVNPFWTVRFSLFLKNFLSVFIKTLQGAAT